jgi:hypothetical protein
MDEDFQPRSPWVAHRRMVGRAFIAEAGGQGAWTRPVQGGEEGA